MPSITLLSFRDWVDQYSGCRVRRWQTLDDGGDPMQTLDLGTTFGTNRPIIGMIHLLPLPGAVGHPGMAAVLDAALRDAEALSEGGVHGIMIENFGDAPFYPDGVPPETVAAVTRAIDAVRPLTSLPLGVNVLRNDARAALGIAAATGAAFIRVNVHTGAMLTDQGWISGRAHETVRVREALRCPAAILADIMVKHAVPPAGLAIGAAARDTVHRGHADAVIVSGVATGAAADIERVRQVRASVDCPLLIGSGLDSGNAATLLAVADGAIVGSAFQRDGRAGGRIEPDRVRALMAIVNGLPH
jgi:uncharacterized protein